MPALILCDGLEARPPSLSASGRQLSSWFEAAVHWEGVAKVRLLSSQIEAAVHWEGVASSPPVVKLT